MLDDKENFEIKARLTMLWTLCHHVEDQLGDFQAISWENIIQNGDVIYKGLYSKTTKKGIEK